MGFGQDEDYQGGPDLPASTGMVVYRWSISRQSPGSHDPSPGVSRPVWLDLLDAAEISASALDSAVDQVGGSLATWWGDRNSTQRARLRTVMLAARGL